MGHGGPCGVGVGARAQIGNDDRLSIAMPRHGALTLGDYPHEDVRLECRCGRKALYRKAELAKRVGLAALLPTLLLQIAQRVGRSTAAQTLAGKPVAGFEQCQMHYPALM